MSDHNFYVTITAVLRLHGQEAVMSLGATLLVKDY